MTEKNNGVKSALRWMMIGRGSSQTISWLVTILVIRLLTPEDYGLLAMASIFMFIAEVLGDMGLGNALVQAKNPTEKNIRQVFTAILLLNTSLYFGFVASAPYIAKMFGEVGLTEIIIVLALQFPLLSLQAVPVSLLSRQMHFRTQSIVGAAAAIVNSAVTLILAWLNFGVWSLVFGTLAAALARVIFLGFSQRVIYLPTLDFSGFKSMFSFGGLIVLSGILQYIQQKSAHLLIGKYLGKADLGLYSVANRLATLPMQKIAGMLGQVGFAAFAKIQHDMPLVRSNYIVMTEIVCLFSFPLFWGIACVAPNLVLVFLGEKWVAATVPLQAIAMAAPLRMLYNTTKPALNGIGNATIVFRSLLVMASTMPIAFYLGLRWGVNGVSIVWVTYYPILFLFFQLRCLTALGIAPLEYFKSVFRPILISTLALSAAIFADIILGDVLHSPISVLFVQVVLSASLYLGLSYILNRKALMRSMRLIF